MKIAISALERSIDSQIDPRFGRARYLALLDTEAPDGVEFFDNSVNLHASQGAGIQTARKVAELGARAVVSGHVGPKAYDVLSAAGIDMYTCGEGSVKSAFEKFQGGELEKLGKQACAGKRH